MEPGFQERSERRPRADCGCGRSLYYFLFFFFLQPWAHVDLSLYPFFSLHLHMNFLDTVTCFVTRLAC
jgi:hypothetical protein